MNRRLVVDSGPDITIGEGCLEGVSIVRSNRILVVDVARAGRLRRRLEREVGEPLVVRGGVLATGPVELRQPLELDAADRCFDAGHPEIMPGATWS